MGSIHLLSANFDDRLAPSRFTAAGKVTLNNYLYVCLTYHVALVPSRRDDLEAAALMLIHLLTPNGLPWTRNGVPRSDPEHDRLKKMKRSKRPEELCEGMPDQFEEFLRYTRRLKFGQTPNYQQWINEFRELAIEEGFPASYDFVWPVSAV